MYDTDLSLLGEIYVERIKSIITESPDKFNVNNKESFDWRSEATLVSSFLSIGNQWFLGNPKEIHSELFGRILSNELVKTVPGSLRGAAYLKLNKDKKKQFIVNNIATQSDILANAYTTYKHHGFEDDYIDYIVDIIDFYADKSKKPHPSIEDKNEWLKDSCSTLFYDPDIAHTRKWFNAGRLWLNPITNYKRTLPGLYVSVWNKKAQSISQSKIEDILKDAGYNFSHTAADGDANIDPYQKHIKISQQQVNSKNWDDIKYPVE